MQIALQKHISFGSLGPMTPIGRGSFSNVYRSTYQRCVIAVKLINIHRSRDDDPRLRIREVLMELRILVQISHPNIVGFLGMCLDLNGAAPCAGLVFEMCHGGTLHDAVHGARACLTPEHKLSIAHQIAAGMSYLHTRRVLHRDLNTKNVLLDADLRPKIADFGCSVLPAPRAQTAAKSNVPPLDGKRWERDTGRAMLGIYRAQFSRSLPRARERARQGRRAQRPARAAPRSASSAHGPGCCRPPPSPARRPTCPTSSWWAAP